MMRWLLLFVMAVSLFAVPLEAQDNEAPAVSRDELLVHRNIFMRNRRPPRPANAVPVESPPHETVAPAPPPPPPGLNFALRGIALQGEDRVAFIEDLRTQESRRVTVGDEIADRRIRAIELDYIELAGGEQILRIDVGDDLTGSTARVNFVPGREVRSGAPTVTGVRTGGGDSSRRGRGGPQRGDTRTDPRTELRGDVRGDTRGGDFRGGQAPPAIPPDQPPVIIIDSETNDLFDLNDRE